MVILNSSDQPSSDCVMVNMLAFDLLSHTLLCPLWFKKHYMSYGTAYVVKYFSMCCHLKKLHIAWTFLAKV